MNTQSALQNALYCHVPVKQRVKILYILGVLTLASCGGGEPAIQSAEPLPHSTNSPTAQTEQAAPINPLVGIWDISRSHLDANSNSVRNEDYVAVRADKTFAQYDYQGDAWGTGYNCYIKKEGRLIFEQTDLERYSYYYNNMWWGYLTINLGGDTPAIERFGQDAFNIPYIAAPYAESDILPICTPAQTPYNNSDTMASLPGSLKTRIPSYATQSCNPLSGSSDVGTIAGLWDVSTVSGNQYDTIIVHDTRFLNISQSGVITNYEVGKDSYQNYEQCYRIEDNMAVITQLNNSQMKVTYYGDSNCELEEETLNLARVTDQSGSLDLLLIGGPEIDVIDANANVTKQLMSRFPEVADISSTKLASLNICTPNPDSNM